MKSAGQLVCSYDVSGLGNVSSTTGTCSGNNTAVYYQCINNGGKNPSDGNKATSNGAAGTSQAVPVHNGRASGSLLVNPVGPPAPFSCHSGQTLYLVSSCYSDTSMNIGGATTNDGTVCSGPIMVKQ